jgi:hypothetical protein
MDRELTVNLTPRIIRWTIFYQLRPLLLIFGIMGLVVIWNFYMVFSHGSPMASELLTQFLPYLLFPVFFGVIIYSSYRKNLALIAKMKTANIKYRITDDWLYVESDLGTGQNSWLLYKGLWKNAKVWRVVLNSGGAHVFPVEQLDEELKIFLSAKLPNKGRGANWFFRVLAGWLLVLIIILYFLKLFR